MLKILTSINTIGYYSELAAICEMTLERVLIFFAPDVHREASKKKIPILIFPWIFGLFMVGINAAGGCYKKFNPSTFQYITVCEDCEAPMKPFLIQFMFVLGQAAPGGMFICYIAIIGKVIKIGLMHNSGNKKGIQNFKLVIQFIIICLFQWFSAFFFFMVPYSFGTTLTGVLLTNTCGMINPAVNTIVMFSSNNRVKQTVTEIIKQRKLLLSKNSSTNKSHQPVKSKYTRKTLPSVVSPGYQTSQRQFTNIVKVTLRPSKK